MLHAGTAPKPWIGVTVTSSALLPSGPTGTMLVLYVPACTYWVGLSPSVGPSLPWLPSWVMLHVAHTAGGLAADGQPVRTVAVHVIHGDVARRRAGVGLHRHAVVAVGDHAGPTIAEATADVVASGLSRLSTSTASPRSARLRRA
jgi:hypothetical protein